MKKRFLSILTALCLTLTLLPTAALADEGEGGEDEEILTQADQPVTTKEGLSNAISQAQNGDTITLGSSIELSSTLTINVPITLDLAGYTLSASAGVSSVLAIKADTTILGGTVSGGALAAVTVENATVTVNNATLSTTGNYGLMLGSDTAGIGGSAIIESGSTIVGEGFAGVAVWGTYATGTGTNATSSLTVNGGSIKGRYYGISGNGSWDDTYIELNGGIIEAIDNTDSTGIYHPQGGTMVINDGTTIRGLVGVQICGGNVTINGGNIQSTDTTEREAPYKDANEGDGNILDGSAVSIVSRTAYGDANVTINGGTFSAYESNDAVKQYGYKKGDGGYEVIPNPTKVEVEIFAGEFSSDVSNYVVDGAKWDENTGTIVPDVTGDTVATVGNIAYDNLNDAIEAAPMDATVTLVADAVLNATGIKGGNGAQALTIDKALTINGQGKYTIKGENFAENVRLITVTNNADVTFTNVILDGNNHKPDTQGARHGLNLWNAGTVTLNNVTINNCDWYAVANNGSNLIVNGLTTTGNAWGINLDNNATATINNANISESSSIVYENAGSGSLTVNGGTFQNVVVQAEEAEDVCGGRIDLKGGSFNDITTSGEGTYNDTSIVTVSGGTYHQNVSEYLADGLAWNPSNGAVYDPSQNRPSSGSSSDPSYSPILDVSDGGSIKVNPRTPEEGDEVTITVDPDSGYEVDEVTVTDRNGREVKVTAERDGTYTFTQPRGRVTISVTFVREGGSTFFSDVPESFWAYDEIAWAYDNGYVNGTSASAFSPNASISRQQVWMILARLSGADPANMSAAREWAVTNGVSDGTTPGGAVTRQQLVALLYRYATLMGYANDQRADLSAYPDAGTVAGYAVEPMQWSVANSIVGGTSNGTLDPTGTATRAQFAVILYRFWDQVG